MSLPAPILAGNWKMNHGPVEARRFFAEFCRTFEPRPDRTVVIFPPAVSIEAAVQAVADRPDLRIGIQNIHWEGRGAFTGEVSAAMAVEAGVSVVLAGHSERRHVFGETDEEVGRKASAALAAGLHAVICIGETLAERESGSLEPVLDRQIAAALAAVEQDRMGRVAIAYEPVWAIGTGVNATPEDAAAAHGFVRRRIADRYGPALARAIPILYGGSVNPANAGALLAASDVDGLLVGGASLKADSFARIAATPAPR